MNNKAPTPELSEEVEARFDDEFLWQSKSITTYMLDVDGFKQFMASELHLQAQKYIEQVEELETYNGEPNPMVMKNDVLELLKKDL